MSINERIKHIADTLYNGNVNDMCRAIEVKQATMSNIVAGRLSKPSFEVISAIIENTNIDSNWLITGEGEMLKEKSQAVEIKPIYTPKCAEPTQEETVFLYDLEAAANLNHLLLNKHENIIGKISIPDVPLCDGAVYVRGDSMYPLLKSGDIIAYKAVPNDIRNIIYGEMYLISIDMAGDEYLTVKYINHSDKGEEWIRLASFNPLHEPKDFPLSSVRAMALVKFSIRMNTMK